MIDARVSLLIENLLDLTHEAYLHGDSIGDEHVGSTPIVVEKFPDHVSATRKMPGIESAPLFERFGARGTVDRSQIAEYWAPGLCLTHTDVKPHDPNGTHVKLTVIHCVTPETAHRTRYHFALARTFALDDRSVDEGFLKATRRVLDQDGEALAAQERRLSELPDAIELSISTDAGALATRKLIAERLEAEAHLHPTRSPAVLA